MGWAVVALGHWGTGLDWTGLFPISAIQRQRQRTRGQSAPMARRKAREQEQQQPESRQSQWSGAGTKWATTRRLSTHGDGATVDEISMSHGRSQG
ncbi:hypothetical protein BP6252_02327 [Coleophoma cylindrospora]|uniref:Uncharacterized protein n=1 Tax=Coleophoma cylindrospora TaxID=1849047 RepID=A0A3D8SEG3_9HELO|nr:hypothetical protein BP6252_02327 [Coleophoma cylindrospora]